MRGHFYEFGPFRLNPHIGRFAGCKNSVKTCAGSFTRIRSGGERSFTALWSGEVEDVAE
jgi:hypothetical protein